MRTLPLLLAAFALLAGPAPRSAAWPGGTGPVLTLSTDMLRFDAPSTRLFLGWGEAVDELARAGLDGASGLLGLDRGGRWLGRLGLLAAFAAMDAVASRAFSITAHDAGHLEAALAAGASRAWLVRSSDPAQEMGIGEFLLEAFDPFVEPGLYVYQLGSPTLAEKARVAGAGLNVNLGIAAAIARRIGDGEGHVMDAAPYLLNKLWGIEYFLETGPTSDGAAYVRLLNQQGFTSVTREQIIGLHAGALLVSGAFLALCEGTLRYVVDGESAAAPLRLRAGPATVYWPEVTTWLNPDSVSMEVSTLVGWGTLARSWVALDVPVLGRTGSAEVTIGSDLVLGAVALGAEVTARPAAFPFLRGSVEVRWTDRSSVAVEGFYGRGETLRELRGHPGGPGAAVFLRRRL